MGYYLCMNGLPKKPSWDLLYETASAQHGHFTTAQAAEAGYSTQLLLKHIRAGRIMRTRRGIYRLVHFPVSEHEELTVAWLWSDQAGVISHLTALALYGLSDVLPAKVHLTLPQDWLNRRFRVPPGVVLHHANVPLDERTWFGAVPVTNPRRTLNDCALEALAPDLLRQAAHQAIRRGIVSKAELPRVEEALSPYGGIGQ
mgnify:FL=1